MKIDLLQVTAIIVAASTVDALPAPLRASSLRPHSDVKLNSTTAGLESRTESRSSESGGGVLVRRADPHRKMPDLSKTDHWFPGQGSQKPAPDKPESGSQDAVVAEKGGASSSSSTSSQSSSGSSTRSGTTDRSTRTKRRTSRAASRTSSASSGAKVIEYVNNWLEDHPDGATTPKTSFASVSSTPLRDPRYPNLFREKSKIDESKVPSAGYSTGPSGSSTPFLNDHDWTTDKSRNPSVTAGSSSGLTSPSTHPTSPTWRTVSSFSSSDQDTTVSPDKEDDERLISSSERQKKKLERFRPAPIITTGLGPGGDGPPTSPSPRLGGTDFDKELKDISKNSDEIVKSASGIGKKVPTEISGRKWAAVALGGTLLNAAIFSTLPVKLPHFEPPPAVAPIAPVAAAAK